MNTRTLLFAVSILSASLGYGGKPSQCTNPSLTWTIHQSYADPATQTTYTSAIQGDSSSVYADGTSGVIATLFLCDAETLDATLELGKPRTASVSFDHALATNSNTPSWASSGSTVTGATQEMDVRALGYVPAGYSTSQEFSFTTRFNMSIPESGTWGLVLLNPAPSAPSTDPNGTVSNTPSEDSLVNVQHCPANDAAPVSPCSSGQLETWFVWPASPQVATLLNEKKSPGVNAGQFSMPFYFVITRN